MKTLKMKQQKMTTKHLKVTMKRLKLKKKKTLTITQLKTIKVTVNKGHRVKAIKTTLQTLKQMSKRTFKVGISIHV